MWEFIKLILAGWISTNKVVEKALPSEEERKVKLELKKDRLEQYEKIKIYNRAFKQLNKERNPDVETFVKYSLDHLNEDDQQELVEMLKKRIFDFRSKHHIIYSRWLKENKQP